MGRGLPALCMSMNAHSLAWELACMGAPIKPGFLRWHLEKVEWIVLVGDWKKASDCSLIYIIYIFYNFYYYYYPFKLAIH